MASRRLRPLLRLLRYVRPHAPDAALTVFFGAMGFLLSFVYPLLIGDLIDLASELSSAERRESLLRITQYAALTGLLHAVALYGRGHFNVRLSNAIICDLRRDLFAQLQKLSSAFYARERTGAVMSLLLHDVGEAATLVYSGIVVAALDAAQLALALLLLSSLSVELTVACGIIFPLYALIFYVMTPTVRAASEKLNAQMSEVSANLAEQLEGHSLVKTSTAEKREARRFDGDLSRLHSLVVAQSHGGHLIAACGEVLVHLGTTIVIGFGGWLMLEGELTPGKLTRFLGYVVVLYGPVRRFAELNIAYQQSLSAMARIAEVLELRPAVTEHNRACSEPPSRGAVRFNDVSFSYGISSSERLTFARATDMLQPEHDEAAVLREINLDVAEGERVAIVGHSGAGKTTFVSLLPRLYDVSSGSIMIDGRDVRDYSLSALRSAIAIVQQDSFVFTGTIIDNLRYARPEASEEQVLAAAQAAHAHEFIDKLGDKYATRLGVRGVTLSGGQRQRLSIARALLKDPRILISMKRRARWMPRVRPLSRARSTR
jgi:subfamily B ATP-binding cassette protein MsbA